MQLPKGCVLIGPVSRRLFRTLSELKRVGEHHRASEAAEEFGPIRPPAIPAGPRQRT